MMRNSTRGDVDPFIVMDVMEAARTAEEAGRHIIHMEVGQPGTPAPAAARDALAHAMQDQPLGYTVALGLPALRARIARLYGEWYDVDLRPIHRLVVVDGLPAGTRQIGGAAHGHEVADGEGHVAATQQRGRVLHHAGDLPGDLAGLDLAGLMVASPANPSGTMLGRAEMAALMDAAADQGAAFISDEIYHGIEYEAKAVSALEINDACYVINSFSKYFSMTGWRIGWMVVPPDHVRRVERLAQNLFICPSHASQIAALAAMDGGDELRDNMAVYTKNRQLMLDGLPKAGFDRIAPPDGAFYVYADVSHMTDDSRAFCAEILEQAGVAVTPGLDFDAARGAGTIRFSYARATADITEGLARLERFMRQTGRL